MSSQTIDASLLVIGGGAIGGTAAARMTGHVRRVVVLDADADHVRRLRDPGLELVEPEGTRTVQMEAVASADELDETFDFALVAIKSPHHSALAPLAGRGIAEVFVSLGNGLIQDRLAGIVGGERLLVGLVEWGGTNLGPGRLVRDTEAPIVIGELDGEPTERVQRLAAALAPVGEIKLTSNARGSIWSKLLVNSTFTGLSAVSGLRYGEVAAHPVGREAVFGLWREGMAVGAAEGLRLEPVFRMDPRQLLVHGSEDRATAEAALDDAMGRYGATKPSMLQDLEAGRATEVDVVNGGVVERGRARGVPTPLNDRVVALVHSMERGERSPSPASFSELAELLG